METTNDKMNEKMTIKMDIENTVQTQFKKFDKNQWNKIEQKYDDEITNVVLETMKTLGNDKAKLTEHQNSLKTCGDEIYIDTIRPHLIKLKVLTKEITIKKQDNKTTKKKNKKTSNKLTKDDIIRNNTLHSVTKNVDETIKTFDLTILNVTYGFNSPYAEIKIATLLYAVHFWISKRIVNKDQCYELTMGIKKILNSIATNKNISQVAYADLVDAHKRLSTFCGFTYETTFANFPRLCLMTSYDTVFRNLAIKPYESQVKLMNAIKSTNKGIFSYRAMIGAGKTTIVIALCGYVDILRTLQKANNDKTMMQLIFACSVEPVRHQVCRMAYTQSIPFGIGNIGEDKVVKIINNYNCKDDNNRILIVCDLNCAIELLNKSNEYILFVDEPTVGADQPNHPVTNAISKLMILAPEKTILCSATLPESTEIPSMISYFKEKHPGAEVTSIYSRESMIGCELINFESYTILPHNNSKSCEELQIIVNNLKTKPFIDRLYTAPVLYRLRKRFIENGIPNTVDLECYFSDVSNLTQTNIQKAAIELLEGLLKFNDDNLVTEVCKPLGKIEIGDSQAPLVETKKSSSGSEGFAWGDSESEESDQESKGMPYDLNKIFTEQSHRYLGHCLIITKDPVMFAFEKSKELISKCDTASKIISKYMAAKDKFDSLLQKLESIKNEDDRTKKEQEIKSENKLNIDFPPELRVNTLAHIMKYAPHLKDKIDYKLVQREHNLETLSFEFNVPDWVMLLLFAGIGIYQPHNKLLNSLYTDCILNMTASGQLAFLISDDSICYGANYPLNHVVIEDEIAENHSIGTIFQLMGRTGRVGQSWVGYAYIGDKISTKIMNYVRGLESNGISEEAVNMNTSFNSVIDEIKSVKQIKQKSVVKEQKINIIKSQNIIPLSDVKPIPQELPKEQPKIEPVISKADTHSDWRNKPPQNKSNDSAKAYIPPFKRQQQTTTKDGWTTINAKRR